MHIDSGVWLPQYECEPCCTWKPFFSVDFANVRKLQWHCASSIQITTFISVRTAWWRGPRFWSSAISPDPTLDRSKYQQSLSENATYLANVASSVVWSAFRGPQGSSLFVHGASLARRTWPYNGRWVSRKLSAIGAICIVFSSNSDCFRKNCVVEQHKGFRTLQAVSVWKFFFRFLDTSSIIESWPSEGSLSLEFYA